MQPPRAEPERLLKAGDLARILAVSRTEAYRLMRSDIPVVKLGPGTVRVRLSDLEAFIDSHWSDHDHAE